MRSLWDETSSVGVELSFSSSRTSPLNCDAIFDNFRWLEKELKFAATGSTPEETWIQSAGMWQIHDVYQRSGETVVFVLTLARDNLWQLPLLELFMCCEDSLPLPFLAIHNRCTLTIHHGSPPPRTIRTSLSKEPPWYSSHKSQLRPNEVVLKSADHEALISGFFQEFRPAKYALLFHQADNRGLVATGSELTALCEKNLPQG